MTENPQLNNLHIFGFALLLTLNGENLDKIKRKKGIRAFLVGTPLSPKGYSCYNKRTNVFESWNPSIFRFDGAKRCQRRLLLMTLQASFPNRQKESVYDNPDPHPELQNVSPFRRFNSSITQEAMADSAWIEANAGRTSLFDETTGGGYVANPDGYSFVPDHPDKNNPIPRWISSQLDVNERRTVLANVISRGGKYRGVIASVLKLYGIIELYFVRTEYNWPEMFTKALPEESSQAVNKSPTHYPCDSARTFRVILFSIHNDEWKSFQCHHQTALRRPYALSWKPCQGDSLNLPDHRIHKDGDGDASFQLESNSLPHAHAQTTKTYYKHQDSRIMKAQELKTKTSAQTLIYKIFLQRYQVYQGRLLASFQDDAKYEHVGQDTRSQGGKDDQDKRIKI
ncbi:hypothetical protein Tco_0373206 [Tanacetum coccineum]